MPRNHAKQQLVSDTSLLQKIKEKILKVLLRRYIKTGHVESLTNFFAVLKAGNDIRLVYDATMSGLNDAVWAPSFGMPTVNSALDQVSSRTHMGDADMGEFFLNFNLDVTLQPYVGLDVSGLGLDTQAWVHWGRMLMGFKPSPYVATRQRIVAEDVARGDHLNPSNPYHWTMVVLNLPGMEDYDPTMPWVFKAKLVEGEWIIANDHVGFCDDFRINGSSDVESWNTGNRLLSVLQWKGIQDAPRKRRPPSQRPGAWAGSVIRVIEQGVGVTVSEEKWQKLKGIVALWLGQVQAGETKLDRKQMESDRGFLVYVAQTFPVMKSYCKGFNLTLESWRPHRDSDGWKLRPSAIANQENEDEDETETAEAREEESMKNLTTKVWSRDGAESQPLKKSTAPSTVSPVTRFLSDLEAMSELTRSDMAPLRMVRPRYKIEIKYGFGDASGSGFGATVTTVEGLRIRFGVWGSDENQQSSNYRELRNLVEALEDLWEKGELVGVEVFIFTDNSTAECAYFKGGSTDRLLHELVLRLKKLEMEAGAKIHLIHCAGTRQIAQGSDGLSRGDLTEGVMSGVSMLQFVPIHLGAFERAPDSLLQWIRGWTGSPGLEPLTPNQWFTLGQNIAGGYKGEDGLWFPEYKTDTRLWAPAPAAGRPVMEQLRTSRHRHFNCLHVLVCPRLMCHEWRRGVLKEADFVFYIPAGARDFWPKDMCEPLMVAVCLPFIRHFPWKLQRAPKLLEMERRVREVFKGDDSDPGIVLRKLCQLPGRLDSMPAELVSQVLLYRK